MQLIYPLTPGSLRLRVGHRALCRFQLLLLRAEWSSDAGRDDVLDDARQTLEEGAILAVDVTCFPKKGKQSVGAARQCTGTAGNSARDGEAEPAVLAPCRAWAQLRLRPHTVGTLLRPRWR
ncbi:transposase [Myxococcus sp. AB036A]|uniref:transposase n=1 Tax=Myxococcus sp. AB036A TaxID=2562793 RepID=UPI001E6380BA|nr:transposase [Myxococcus sp. AB036A]